MMEWETGIHTCNKHEMTLQVVFIKTMQQQKPILYLDQYLIIDYYLQMSTMSQQSIMVY